MYPSYSRWPPRKIRENVTSAPTSQVEQLGKLVGRWHGWVIPPLWDDVTKGNTPMWVDVIIWWIPPLSTVWHHERGIPPLWDDVTKGGSPLWWAYKKQMQFFFSIVDFVNSAIFVKFMNTVSKTLLDYPIRSYGREGDNISLTFTLLLSSSM